MGKLIDMVGKRYGRLVVLSQEPSVRGSARWLCQCDCGKQTVVDGGMLRSGRTKSCGCYMSELNAMRRAKDLTGQKFNRLTAIRYDHQDKKHNYVWECKCDCGNIVYVPATLLLSGHTKSCGCLQKEKAGSVNFTDITGRKFARLTVENRCGSDPSGQALWNCKCDCGNSVVATTVALVHGRTLSCGCIKSKGEQIIQSVLEKHKIFFKREYWFKWCKDKEPLRFDFYLPDYNVAIEYDGEFHYHESRLKHDLESQQKRDKIKTQFCKENDIILFRIPYWEQDNIESILTDWLFLYDSREANSLTVDLSA